MQRMPMGDVFAHRQLTYTHDGDANRPACKIVYEARHGVPVCASITLGSADSGAHVRAKDLSAIKLDNLRDDVFAHVGVFVPNPDGGLVMCAEGLRYRSVLTLIATTGLRRGEALALHWADIDLDAGILVVRGTLGRVGGKLMISEPKTDRSRRVVPISPPLVALPRAHRANQQTERQAARDQWSNDGLVFATESGTAVDPRNNILRTVQGLHQ